MSFSFYTVNGEYSDFLRKVDLRVPYTMNEKMTRPFVGIVFEVNDLNYYAPLTSPKPKHLKMREQIDFLKIKNGKWGAINFNNMIPVIDSALTQIDVTVKDSDSKSEIAYKNLLSNQLSWCNANKNIVLRQANRLYTTIVENRAGEPLKKRCCDFKIVEEQCFLYEAMQKIDEFCKRKSDKGADFSDLSKIEVAHTVTDDKEHKIQAYINLVGFTIETHIDGTPVRTKKFNDLEDMIENALPNLNFDELVAVSDEELAPFIKKSVNEQKKQENTNEKHAEFREKQNKTHTKEMPETSTTQSASSKETKELKRIAVKETSQTKKTVTHKVQEKEKPQSVIKQLADLKEQRLRAEKEQPKPEQSIKKKPKKNKNAGHGDEDPS